jgi:hypothetical protein
MTSWCAHALEQTALEPDHPGRPDLATRAPDPLQAPRLTAFCLSDGSGTGARGTHADPEECTGKAGSDSLSDGEPD